MRRVGGAMTLSLLTTASELPFPPFAPPLFLLAAFRVEVAWRRNASCNLDDVLQTRKEKKKISTDVLILFIPSLAPTTPTQCAKAKGGKMGV